MKANPTFRFQTPSCRHAENELTYSCRSHTGKRTRSARGLIAPSSRPNDPQLPNPDAANNPVPPSAAFFHRRENQADGQATIWPPGQRKSGQRLPYCRESPVDTKQYLRWEVVKAKPSFPVRMYTLQDKARGSGKRQFEFPSLPFSR